MKILRITAIFAFCVLQANNVMAAGSLSVQILNWDGTTASGGVQFPSSQATVKDPWVRSPQYLRIVYSCDRLKWGLRIVTDNEKDIGQVYPKPLYKGADGKWHDYKYISGKWDVGDDGVTFAGLIDPKFKDKPDYRVAIAWQAFSDPVVEPDWIYKHPLYGWNVGANPDETYGYVYDWAYVVDKSNKWNGSDSVGGVFYPPPAPAYSQKYEMILTGDPYVNFLARYPVVSGSPSSPANKEGDGDIAVYLAACFGIIDKEGNFVGIVPGGNYKSNIYLELYYE